MAKFNFKFEGVLRQRTSVEQQRQRELAEIQAVYAAAEAELRALDVDVQATNDDVKRNHLTGRLDLSFITAHRRFMAAMQRKAVAIAQRMAATQRQVDDSRKALAAAARDRKVLEKLREKQFATWREDQSRRELAALDEVGMQMTHQQIADDDTSEQRREDLRRSDGVVSGDSQLAAVHTDLDPTALGYDVRE